MELLRQQEQVSTAELDRLMAEIVKLDPETRKEKLVELTKAMNQGDINGRF